MMSITPAKNKHYSKETWVKAGTKTDREVISEITGREGISNDIKSLEA